MQIIIIIKSNWFQHSLSWHWSKLYLPASILSKFHLPDSCSINKPVSCQNVHHVKVPLNAPSAQESEMLSQPSKMVVLSVPSQELTCFSFPQMLKPRSLSASRQTCSESFVPGESFESCPAPLTNAELLQSTFQLEENFIIWCYLPHAAYKSCVKSAGLTYPHSAARLG